MKQRWSREEFAVCSFKFWGSASMHLMGIGGLFTDMGIFKSCGRRPRVLLQDRIFRGFWGHMFRVLMEYARPRAGELEHAADHDYVLEFVARDQKSPFATQAKTYERIPECVI